jgi:hypothetical protein
MHRVEKGGLTVGRIQNNLIIKDMIKRYFYNNSARHTRKADEGQKAGDWFARGQ